MLQTSPVTSSSSFFQSSSSSPTELPKVTALAPSSFPSSPYPGSQSETPPLTPPETWPTAMLTSPKIPFNRYLEEVVFAKSFAKLSPDIQHALTKLEMNLHDGVNENEAKMNLKQKGSQYQLDLIIQDSNAECKFFVKEPPASVATCTSQSSQ